MIFDSLCHISNDLSLNSLNNLGTKEIKIQWGKGPKFTKKVIDRLGDWYLRKAVFISRYFIFLKWY